MPWRFTSGIWLLGVSVGQTEEYAYNPIDGATFPHHPVMRQASRPGELHIRIRCDGQGVLEAQGSRPSGLWVKTRVKVVGFRNFL